MPAPDRDIVIVTGARSSNSAQSHGSEGLGSLLFLPQGLHCLGDFHCTYHDSCHLPFTAATKHVLLKVGRLARAECNEKWSWDSRKIA